jgi:hypothetical protein
VIYETCFDRDYECCDLTPPPDGLRYDEWYDAHVEAWKAHQGARPGPDARREVAP